MKDLSKGNIVPKISAVIPCYNARRWVGRAISSLLTQEGVEVEVIVIDDGSTDGSLDVIRQYSDGIHWETSPNRGACAARNRGLAIARADYVMFLDADDYLEGPFLKGCCIKLGGGGDVCLGRVTELSENTTTTAERCMPDTSSWQALLVNWLDGWFVPPCGIVWKTEYIRNLGGWNESLKKNQDGEIVMRAATDHARFCTSLDGTAIYWHHSSPDRISTITTPEKMLDALSVYIELRNRLGTAGELTPSLDRAISRATHRLERKAVRCGLSEAAKRIGEYRTKMNWPKYEGSMLHRLACACLGLSAKEYITNIITIKMLRFNQNAIGWK